DHWSLDRQSVILPLALSLSFFVTAAAAVVGFNFGAARNDHAADHLPVVLIILDFVIVVMAMAAAASPDPSVIAIFTLFVDVTANPAAVHDAAANRSRIDQEDVAVRI